MVHIFATWNVNQAPVGSCTRNVLLGQTSGPASPVCLSAWQNGWCLGRGGSLASSSTPTTHSHCFGDVRSLPSHLWTCRPWACPTPFESPGSACLPSLVGQQVPGVHHLLCKEILSCISCKSVSSLFHQAPLAQVLQDLGNNSTSIYPSPSWFCKPQSYSPHSLHSTLQSEVSDF